MNGLEKITKESPILHNLPNLGIQEFQANGSSLPWACHCHWLGTWLWTSGHGPLPREAAEPTGWSPGAYTMCILWAGGWQVGWRWLDHPTSGQMTKECMLLWTDLLHRPRYAPIPSTCSSSSYLCPSQPIILTAWTSLLSYQMKSSSLFNTQHRFHPLCEASPIPLRNSFLFFSQSDWHLQAALWFRCGLSLDQTPKFSHRG